MEKVNFPEGETILTIVKFKSEEMYGKNLGNIKVIFGNYCSTVSFAVWSITIIHIRNCYKRCKASGNYDNASDCFFNIEWRYFIRAIG